MLCGLAHRQEVRHDVGKQISAHFHSGVKVILKQAARQLHSFYLWNTHVCSHQNREADIYRQSSQPQEAYLRHVGDGNVARLSYNPHGEIGFESWFIETGESSSSKGGFKLRWCQNPNDSKINVLWSTKLCQDSMSLTLPTLSSLSHIYGVAVTYSINPCGSSHIFAWTSKTIASTVSYIIRAATHYDYLRWAAFLYHFLQ